MKQPEKSYQMIEGAQWRHIWVVGDIHGCFALLMAKLRADLYLVAREATLRDQLGRFNAQADAKSPFRLAQDSPGRPL